MESTYLSDPKYRTFRTSVERAVKAFETSSEWADLISCLSKLNKVLQTHMQYNVLPKKVTISKRLAQCLHPALPSGVHIKALETYDLILKRIGRNGLAQDLFLFTSGLFPLLSHASMTVKPTLLELYENHFIELGRDMIPCLRGMVLALLPGLEEGSETFDKSNDLLLNVSQQSDTVLFFEAVWHAVLACPHVRLPAVNFLVSQIKKQLPPSEQPEIMGDDINRMVAAVSIAFSDGNVLVLRSLLDLVLVLFPFNDQFLPRSDIINILTSSLSVLSCRDMSLNRRFYMWILGSKNPSEESDLITEHTYFESHSEQLLIQAVYNLLKQADPNGQDKKQRSVRNSLKPFRVVMALLDRPEISVSLVEVILLEVLQALRVCYGYWVVHETGMGMKSPRSMKRKSGGEGKSGRGEDVLKTVNLLCGLFEAGFVWQFVAELMERVARAMSLAEEKSTDMSISDLAALVEFLLDSLFIRSNDDVSTIHLPTLLTHYLISLCLCCASASLQELTIAFQLSSRLLSCCEPSAKLAVAPQSLLDKLKSVCGSQLQQTGDCDLASCSIELVKTCVVRFIESHVDSGDLACVMGRPVSEKELSASFEALCRLLIDVSSFPVLSEGSGIPESSSLSCFASERGWLQSLLNCVTSNTVFPVFVSATTAVLDLAAIGLSYNVTREESRVSSVIIKPLITAHDFQKIRNSGLIQTVVDRLWCVLKEGEMQCREIAANAMGQLCALRPCVDLVESAINDRLTSTSLTDQRSALQTFSSLWELTEHGIINTLTPTFERPLFVMLESLHNPDSFSQQITTSWLSKLLRTGDMNRLLAPLLQVLLHPSTIRSQMTCSPCTDWMQSSLLLYVQYYDTHRCRHALECLQSIVTSDTHGFISSAALSVVSQHAGLSGVKNIRSLLLKHEASIADSKTKTMGDSSPVTRNYMETVLSLLLWFMQSYFPASHSISSDDIEDKAVIEDNALIQTMSTKICSQIIEQLDSAFASSSSSNIHLPASGGYIRALFTLCGVHKALLSCLSITLQQQLDKLACPQFLWAVDSSKALMVETIKLTFAVLRLEYSQGLSKSLAETAQSIWSYEYNTNKPSSLDVLELCPLSQQPSLLALILHGLSSTESEHVMQHFLQLLCNVLPLLGAILPVITQHVVVRLCAVLRRCSLRQSKLLVTALAHITQFCLTKSEETLTSPSHRVKKPVVLDFDGLTGMSPLSSQVVIPTTGGDNGEGVKSAAAVCLSLLPQTLRSLATVWKNVLEVEHLPVAKQLKEVIVHLLQLLIAVHDTELLLSVAQLCTQLASTENSGEEGIVGDEWQKIIHDMLKSIPTLPLDILIRSATELVKELKDEDTTPRVVIFLQQTFLRSSSKELLVSWPDFYVFTREVLPQVSTKPPDLFCLVRSLHAFSSVVAACKEKKIRKEAQELTQKVLDCCCSIVGTSLERKSWLGRSLIIRPSLLSNCDVPQPLPDANESESDPSKAHGSSDMNILADIDYIQIDNVAEEKETDEEATLDGKTHRSPDLSEFTTQALEVMSQCLAPFVDSMFGGEEKDRVVNLLYSVLAYVFPFLRCHNSVAASSYTAASALLSSVSEYQYTRKAWSKEAFELFLGASFFRTDSSSLTSWLSIVDNLMTQDKNTFKELLSRSQTPMQGGLALFSNTEQDIEQRTRFVKRLAFAVFSGEMDQYQRHLPSIQERLSESLRIQTVPLLHEKVFFVFRVLLLRISPHHLASFWPIINTELVHVFQQMEQDLCLDANQYTLNPEHKEMLDDSWVRLYLAACKLLELPRHVPTECVPQFQMHGWGFCCSASSDRYSSVAFQPYVSRVLNGIKKRLTAATPNDSLVRVLASSLERLSTFDMWPMDSRGSSCQLLSTQSVCEYEDEVLKDFLE